MLLQTDLTRLGRRKSTWLTRLAGLCVAAVTLWHFDIIGRPRRNCDNRRQPDLNLCEPSPELAAAWPKLKLLPRTVKYPVNTIVHTERNAGIFGIGKPHESLVNETKWTLSQSNKDSQGTGVINGPYCQTGFRTHTRTWFVHVNSASICLSHCDIVCYRLFVGNSLRCVCTLIDS